MSCAAFPNQRHHRLQQEDYTCILACCQMVMDRGTPGIAPLDEAALFEQLTSGALSLQQAARYWGWYAACWDPERGSSVEVLCAQLQGQWCIVVVGAPLLERLNRAAPARRAQSPYGVLVEDPTAPALSVRHALVLTDYDLETQTFAYLDPWFSAEGQPFIPD